MAMVLRAAVAIVAMFLGAASGFASDPAGEHGSAADHAHHHEQTLRGGPQPQDPISIDMILMLWTLVLFLALLFVGTQVAWQPLLGLIQDREKRIADILTEAENLKSEARLLREQNDRELAVAHDEVRRLLDQVRAEAGKESESLLAAAKDRIAKERESAIQEVEEAKRVALASLDQTSAGLAARMVSKFVGRSVDPSAVRRHMET
jgi:F-type H+-transporting ATPase subunit b